MGDLSALTIKHRDIQPMENGYVDMGLSENGMNTIFSLQEKHITYMYIYNLVGGFNHLEKY